MQKTQAKKNYKVFRKYLISFIIGFTIPSFAIVAFFNQYTTEVINKKAENETRSRFVRRVDDIDKRLDEVVDAIIRLSVDEETTVISRKIELDSQEYFRLNQYSKLLSEHIMLSNLIKNITIYYNKSDMIITQLGKQGLYSYLNQFYRDGGISVQQMEGLIKSINNRHIIPVKDIETGHLNSERFITLVQSFPINNLKALGSIVVSLDRDVFMRMMGENADGEFDNFIMVDDKANILASIKQNTISQELIRQIIQADSKAPQKITIEGKKQIVCCQKSSINNWWYIYFLPQEIVTSSQEDFRELLFVIIIVYLVFGFGISVFLALFNYNPIRVLIREIDSKVSSNDIITTKNHSDEFKGDEFGIIQSFIHDLYTEKNKLDSQMNIYTNEVKNNFLRELTIEVVDSKKFSEMTRLLNLKFSHSRYCFLCFTLNTNDNMNEKELNKVVLILAMIEEWGLKFGTGYRLNIDKGMIGFVLNIKDQISYMEVMSSYRELINYINLKYSEQIRAGAGCIYEGYDKISISYREAEEAVKYSIFYQCDLFLYQDVIGMEHSKYSYPEEIMNKLLNSVVAGDLENVEMLLSQLAEHYFQDKKLSLISVGKLYDDLVELLHKAMEKYFFDNTNSLLKELELDVYNNQFDCLNDMLSHIEGLYKTVCNNVLESRENSLNDTSTEIIKFINDNCHDANLSCNYVAEKFKMSQPNLSNILKQYTGMNYGDYVNRLRIEKAKELFNENNLSINDIALRLGYSSGNSFIRTFKSFEGITPGQYRNLYVGDDKTS